MEFNNNEIPDFDQRISFQNLNDQSLNEEGEFGLGNSNSLNRDLDINDDSLNQNVADPNDDRRSRGNRGVNSISKGQWTSEEDRRLIDLVQKYGVKNWAQVAHVFKGRTGKQCRERWFNNLRPDIKREKISQEEEIIIVEGHKQHGSKWATIAKLLPGRTENAIKNYFNASKRRLGGRNIEVPSTPLEMYILNCAPGSSNGDIREWPDSINDAGTGSHVADWEQVSPEDDADMVMASFAQEEGTYAQEAYFSAGQLPAPLTEPVDTRSAAQDNDHMIQNSAAGVELPYFPDLKVYSEHNSTMNYYGGENNVNAVELGVNLGVDLENDVEFLKFAGWD